LHACASITQGRRKLGGTKRFEVSFRLFAKADPFELYRRITGEAGMSWYCEARPRCERRGGAPVGATGVTR
jgi:hypothetical protein